MQCRVLFLKFIRIRSMIGYRHHTYCRLSVSVCALWLNDIHPTAKVSKQANSKFPLKHDFTTANPVYSDPELTNYTLLDDRAEVMHQNKQVSKADFTHI